jgi:hypothetical protein
VWLGDLVKDLPSFAFAGKQPAPLHQSQVFRSHIVRDAAVLSQFAHSVPPMQQQLHNPQPHRVSQRLQALSRLRKRLRITGWFGFLLGFRWHLVSPYITIS